MSRESENAILLLIGVSTAMIAITGVFTRYVKPAMMPWLLITAVVLIVLAVTAMVDDIRRMGGHGGPRFDHDEDAHAHNNRVTWALMVPVVVLIFITPPALRPQASVPSVTSVSTEVLRRPFPPLPAGRAPEVTIPNVMLRAAQDSAGSLDGRLITVIGFSIHGTDTVDLGRFSVLCCAADARLARVHLAGEAAIPARAYPEYTWLRVEGVVRSGPGDGDSSMIPTLEVASVREIDPPADVYA